MTFTQTYDRVLAKRFLAIAIKFISLSIVRPEALHGEYITHTFFDSCGWYGHPPRGWRATCGVLTPVMRNEEINTMGAASQASSTRDGTKEKLYCMVQMTVAIRKEIADGYNKNIIANLGDCRSVIHHSIHSVAHAVITESGSSGVLITGGKPNSASDG